MHKGNTLGRACYHNHNSLTHCYLTTTVLPLIAGKIPKSVFAQRHPNNMRLQIPQKFRRNSHMVKEAGYDESAKEIIALMAERLGLADFRDTNILDVGCGTRFSAYMINNEVPVKATPALMSTKKLLIFCKQLQALLMHVFIMHTGRFATHFTTQQARRCHCKHICLLPDRLMSFGCFCFYALDPDDAAAMLRILRQHIASHGKLIFTCRINNTVDGFVDRVPEQPLLRAVFSQTLMEKMIIESGWTIDHFYKNDPRDFIRNYYICSPR